MKIFTIPRARFDAFFFRYGLAPKNATSELWQQSCREQRRTLFKVWVKKIVACLAGRNAKNGQNEILKAYDAQWKKKAFVRYLPKIERSGAPWVWGDSKWVMSNEAGAAIRLLFLEEVLEKLKPASVLEVGAGNGINLLMLAARFPEIRFSGLEPTAGGCETAMHVIENGRLPEVLLEFAPFSLLDVSAPARVKIKQGSAQYLPFKDESVDLVMTSLALEQMEEIRHDALSEIARVAKDWVVMLEPFRDVNASGLRRIYVRTHDYFQGSIAELAQYGLEVEQVCFDMPHKSTLGTALVIARRAR